MTRLVGATEENVKSEAGKNKGGEQEATLSRSDWFTLQNHFLATYSYISLNLDRSILAVLTE